MPPDGGGGGGGGEAYRRALLKKLRAAVAAKTRVDAGDPSLQPAQVEKGRKASVDDALRALKREGLGRGDELVKLALARGVAEGDALMAAAATRRSRAPAATSRDVPTASTSAARAHRHRRGHHHHHHPDDARSADAVTAPPARVISGHVRGACKRAIAALHALAKAGATDAAAASAACAALLNDRKLVDEAADAFQVAKALWAVAAIRRDLVVPTDADAKREEHDALSALTRALASRLAARLRAVAPAMDPRGVATAFWAVATLAETDAMDDADARTFAAPLLEAIDAARRIKGDRYSTDARSTDARLLSGYNAVDAAQVLFACATLRAPPSVAVAAALATRVVARSEPSDAGGGTAAPGAPSAGAKEITAAMWSLASLSSDGLLSAAAAATGEAGAKTAAAAAADAAALGAAIEALARRAAEEAFAESTASSSSSSSSAFGSRAVAECAWAAEKLGRDATTPGGSSHLAPSFGTRRSSSAEQKTSSSSSSALGALRALAEALAARVGAALDAHAPRAVARTLALCASLCVVAGDDESADDAAFRARIVPLAAPLATRALALATSKGRKDVEKRIITLKRKRDDDSEEDANDLASRPSADDLVAALEAVAKLGLVEESRGAALGTARGAPRVAKKLVRAALSAALTRPAEVGGGALSTESRPEKDPSVKEVLDWRVAGRLEHAAFGALGRGFPRADPGRGNESVSSAEKEKNANRRAQTGTEAERAEDRAVLDRLLRRGAEAARAADANLLAIERGALAALGDAVRAAGASGETTPKRVDDADKAPAAVLAFASLGAAASPWGDPRGTARDPSASSRMTTLRGGPAEEETPLRAWLDAVGCLASEWNRFARGASPGSATPPAPPPPLRKPNERLFDAAFVRVPSTRGALAASLAALAAVVRPGGDAWAFGAVSEGARRAADAFEERRLFERVETWTFRGRRANKNRSANINSAPGPARVAEYEYSGGGFVVTRARRTAVEAADAEASLERFRRETTLALPVVVPGTAGGDVSGGDGAGKGEAREHASGFAFGDLASSSGPPPAHGDYSRSKPRAVTVPWVTYPGLFAGGVWDVMTAFLLRSTPASAFRSRDVSKPFAFLDFCSGSGTIAAAARLLAPSDARIVCLDADAVALEAARENLGSDARVSFVASDGWSGLPAGEGDDAETFDLVASNPPVHLALQPDFTVLRALVEGCGRRLRPGGQCWFVAQRYVPVGAICADAGAEGAECVAADDRFAVWRIKKAEPSPPEARAQSRGFESESEGGEKRRKERAKGRDEKDRGRSAKRSKKEKKEKKAKKKKGRKGEK